MHVDLDSVLVCTEVAALTSAELGQFPLAEDLGSKEKQFSAEWYHL